MLLLTVYAHDRSVLVLNVDRQRAHRDLDEALNSWLGADLSMLEHEGRPIWNGDPDALHARTATSDEAEAWRGAWQHERDPEDQLRPVYLVAAAGASPLAIGR
nr:hypothetical protein [uncultured Lichenicoccus sp.]